MQNLFLPLLGLTFLIFTCEQPVAPATATESPSQDLSSDIHLIEGNPLIEEVRNQVAVKRGPVVYCLETPDLPAGSSILDAYLPADAGLTATYKPKMLGGIAEISGDLLFRKDKKDNMYNVLTKPEWERRKTSLVPYFAWSNRGEAEMTVWLPMVWQTK